MKPKYAAVMQPYLFPYLNYFHLIEASHVFVFYDDVQYIKRGWINRNQLLQNGEALRFTIPVSRTTRAQRIHEVRPTKDDTWKRKVFTQLTWNYRRAPYFAQVMELVRSVFDANYSSIAELAIASIQSTYDYLGTPLNCTTSSASFADSSELGRSERLIHITKELGLSHYVNAAGGRELYQKPDFKAHGIELAFIQSQPTAYAQFNHPFVPHLSIIDVLMFNDRDQTNQLLSAYALD